MTVTSTDDLSFCRHCSSCTSLPALVSVSYTHLDVYKRQALDYFITEVLFTQSIPKGTSMPKGTAKRTAIPKRSLIPERYQTPKRETYPDREGCRWFPPCFSFYFSSIRPSVDIVTTCQGINLPLFFRAVTAACSIPPQQGTSILTIVRLLMSF